MVVGLQVKPHAAGFIPVSMVDWEGKIAAIIFLSGCSFRCPYCHNPELIEKGGAPSISWEKISAHLSKKKGWIDGVVITGGEPTINDDLEAMVAAVRELDLLVKLDTNGCRPKMVDKLLSEGQIDFLAIDIKASFSRYDDVTGVKNQANNIRQTIDIALDYGIDHEFRTTVVPGFIDSKDVLEIAEYIAKRGAKRFFLQQFNSEVVLDQKLKKMRPFPPSYIADLAEQCSKFLPTNARGIS